VTRRALVQRLNRQLKKEGRMLKGSRGRGARSRAGQYHLIDIKRNWFLEENVDLEEMGRELRVLAGYERLEEGE
jgi:hypothetical protein